MSLTKISGTLREISALYAMPESMIFNKNSYEMALELIEKKDFPRLAFYSKKRTVEEYKQIARKAAYLPYTQGKFPGTTVIDTLRGDWLAKKLISGKIVNDFVIKNLHLDFFDDDGNVCGLGIFFARDFPDHWYISISKNNNQDADNNENVYYANPEILEKLSEDITHVESLVSSETLPREEQLPVSAIFEDFRKEVNSEEIAALFKDIIQENGRLNEQKLYDLKDDLPNGQNYKHNLFSKEALIQHFPIKWAALEYYPEFEQQLQDMNEYLRQFDVNAEHDAYVNQDSGNRVAYTGEHTLKNLEAKIAAFEKEAKTILNLSQLEEETLDFLHAELREDPDNTDISDRIEALLDDDFDFVFEQAQDSENQTGFLSRLSLFEASYKARLANTRAVIEGAQTDETILEHEKNLALEALPNLNEAVSHLRSINNWIELNPGFSKKLELASLTNHDLLEKADIAFLKEDQEAAAGYFKEAALRLNAGTMTLNTQTKNGIDNTLVAWLYHNNHKQLAARFLSNNQLKMLGYVEKAGKSGSLTATLVKMILEGKPEETLKTLMDKHEWMDADYLERVNKVKAIIQKTRVDDQQILEKTKTSALNALPNIDKALSHLESAKNTWVLLNPNFFKKLELASLSNDMLLEKVRVAFLEKNQESTEMYCAEAINRLETGKMALNTRFQHSIDNKLNIWLYQNNHKQLAARFFSDEQLRTVEYLEYAGHANPQTPALIQDVLDRKIPEMYKKIREQGEQSGFSKTAVVELSLRTKSSEELIKIAARAINAQIHAKKGEETKYAHIQDRCIQEIAARLIRQGKPKTDMEALLYDDEDKNSVILFGPDAESKNTLLLVQKTVNDWMYKKCLKLEKRVVDGIALPDKFDDYKKSSLKNPFKSQMENCRTALKTVLEDKKLRQFDAPVYTNANKFLSLLVGLATLVFPVTLITYYFARKSSEKTGSWDFINTPASQAFKFQLGKMKDSLGVPEPEENSSPSPKRG